MTSHDDLSALCEKPFSDAVEKLEKLLVQSGRAFLLGAGCSICAGLPLTADLMKNAIESNDLNTTSKAILTAIKNLFAGSTTSHIEDYLSELVDLLAIADRRAERGASQAEVPLDGKSYTSTQLRSATEQIKQSISNAIVKQVDIKTHLAFIHAVHQPIRVGKAAHGSIVDYLVLNYDTIIEDALAIERIPFSDGIEGGATGWWNPETFDRDTLEARVLKLHGSIDWCEGVGDSLPRRIAPNLNVHNMKARRILIWPASTKYRETQLDPFAQLADRARRVMRPTRGSQCVLVICGYGFGDAHINIEIDRALRESTGDLTVIAFSSEVAPVGCLKEWNLDEKISEQVLIFARHGFFHGKTAYRTTNDLPWWKFEVIVRLLRGER